MISVRLQSIDLVRVQLFGAANAGFGTEPLFRMDTELGDAIVSSS